MARLYSVTYYDGDNKLLSTAYYSKNDGNQAQFFELIWGIAQTSGALDDSNVATQIDTVLTTGGYSVLSSPTKEQLQTFESGALVKQDTARSRYSLGFLGG